MTMTFIAVILYIVTFLAGFLMLFLHSLHMFQQNSYKPNVQRKWLKEHVGDMTGRSLAFLLSIPVLLFGGLPGLFAACALNLITAWGNRPKEARIPLKLTKRVVRMMVTAGVVTSVFLAAVFLLQNLRIHNNLLLSAAVPLFGVLAPEIVLLANFMNRPVEKAVSRHFYREAEKKLESMPELKVVGITGSYGKTSVKHYLYKLLSAKYNVLMTPGNYNTTLGVVITVREHLKATHEIFLCEMGARNVGDIKEICDLVHPDYGVITSIGPQHLESFQTIENVVKTKFELADALPEDGIAFLNYDNEYIRRRETGKTSVTYGAEYSGCDYRAYDISVSSKGTSFKMKDGSGKEWEFSTKLLGAHNVTNIAGAIAVANRLGVSMETLTMQVRRLEGVEHRLQLIKSPRGLIIDDAYNSNPSGAKAALDVLKQFDGIRILLTPGMVELGEKQYEYNKIFGTQAAGAADFIILVGEKQAKPIKDGALEAGFDPDKLFVVNGLKEGLSRADGIHAGSASKVILLENDLPDNYL